VSHLLFHDAYECLGPISHLGGGIWKDLGFKFGAGADEKQKHSGPLKNCEYAGYGRGKLSTSMNKKKEMGPLWFRLQHMFSA